MFPQPNRMQPVGPAHAYETFAIKRPQAPEFWRPASCEEIDCEAWRNGWVTRVPADLVPAVQRSERLWVSRETVGAETVFTFPPGTPCFAASTHRKLVRPDIPDLFVVRGGDWRGNPTGEHRIHTRPEDWAEHLHEATDRVASEIEKG